MPDPDSLRQILDRYQAEAAVVRTVSNGLWLTCGEPPRPGILDRPLPEWTVVVGAPGQAGPSAGELARLLRVAPQVRNLLVLSGETGLAQRVADDLRRPLRVRYAVADSKGQARMVEAGWRLSWPVFARETVYRPGRSPQLEKWATPVPGLSMAEPGSYRLCPGWRIDVLARGLLVRPESLVIKAEWHRSPASGPQVVLAGTGGQAPTAVMAALLELCVRLPPETRERLTVVEAEISS